MVTLIVMVKGAIPTFSFDWGLEKSFYATSIQPFFNGAGEGGRHNGLLIHIFLPFYRYRHPNFSSINSLLHISDCTILYCLMLVAFPFKSLLVDVHICTYLCLLVNVYICTYLCLSCRPRNMNYGHKYNYN